jgi:hypothetical protein
MKDLGIHMIPPIRRERAAEANATFKPGKAVCPRNCGLPASTMCDKPILFSPKPTSASSIRSSPAAAEAGTAFVPTSRQDLDRVFSIQHERAVHQDNTVCWASGRLQILIKILLRPRYSPLSEEQLGLKFESVGAGFESS